MSTATKSKFIPIHKDEITIFKHETYELITRLTEHQRFLDDTVVGNPVPGPKWSTPELKKKLNELLYLLDHDSLIEPSGD